MILRKIVIPITFNYFLCHESEAYITGLTQSIQYRSLADQPITTCLVDI